MQARCFVRQRTDTTSARPQISSGFKAAQLKDDMEQSMKKPGLPAIGIYIALACSATAATPPTAGKLTRPIKPARLTCEEFLSFDDMTRPKIVYWSEGLTRKDNPDGAVFDVDMTRSLVPYLVEECTKQPRASYWKTMQDTLKRSA